MDDTLRLRFAVPMNDAHLELLASDGWRDLLRDLAIPFALDQRELGDLGEDVLEIGPGPGLTTDLLSPQLSHLTALELDDSLCAALADRYAADPSVTVTHGDATAMPFEDGRFSGAICFTMLHHVPAANAQDRLFREVCRVLQPGALFIANDSVASAELAALHVDDVYNPVDPRGLAERLAAAGFAEVEVRTNDFAWAAHARRPM